MLRVNVSKGYDFDFLLILDEGPVEENEASDGPDGDDENRSGRRPTVRSAHHSKNGHPLFHFFYFHFQISQARFTTKKTRKGPL